MTTRTIDADSLYYVRTKCPACGQVSEVPIRLDARLERTREDCRIGVKLGQKRRDHVCGQTSMTVVAETGEVLFSTGEPS